MLPVIFHKLLSIEEAIVRVEESVGGLKPIGTEAVILSEAVGRVLAEPISVSVDCPPFDRSEVDGYAVRSQDTYGAEEDKPVRLRVVGESAVGRMPKKTIGSGDALTIATGAPLPRGANAVAMVEYTSKEKNFVEIYRTVVPGENVSQTGSDVRIGDIVLRAGTILSSREIAVLATLGRLAVSVYKKPCVAVFSTGDELVSLGDTLPTGHIFDVNGPTIASMCKEIGLHSEYLGILPDDYYKIKSTISKAVKSYDVVFTSGSTSAGLGDIVYKIFNELGNPGIIVHGLKMKPGKPTVAAVLDGKIVIGLPGFPVSAMIAFSAFAKPLLLKLAGSSSASQTGTVQAKMAFRIQAGKGKREFVPVNIVKSRTGLVAYPLLGGSGAVVTLSMGDGYTEVDESTEFVDEGDQVTVTLFSSQLRLAELDIIGSHCPGIDLLVELSKISETKIVNVGSTAGWNAVKAGEADIAGTHLLDETTLEYNRPFIEKFRLTNSAALIRGYARRQGLLVAKGNPKKITTFKDLFKTGIVMINRNEGSGTRAFIDYHLRNVKRGQQDTRLINGYDHEAKTHSAVAAAVGQGRADVGIAVEAATVAYNVDFIPLGEEMFDFLIPKERLDKPAVKQFLSTLTSRTFSYKLAVSLAGYRTLPDTGKIIS